MHAITAVFIDTCIFESAHFDFTSPQFESFIAALKGKKIQLLLPHPTKLEIGRHISEKITAGLAAMKAVQKEHSLLRALPHFPASREDIKKAEAELKKHFSDAWSAFRKRFEVVELAYEGVDIGEVMRWYNGHEAPFGEGKKSKEFPDAFAFCALRNFARDQKANVAVVSADNDFRKACERATQLHYFPTLASLTSELLKGESRYASAMTIAVKAASLLIERIKEQFPELGFVHEIDPDSSSEVSDVKVKTVSVDEDSFQIIGLGLETFNISFSAEVTFSAWVEHVDADSWVSMGGGDVMYLHRCEGTVEDETTITCVARVTTDPEWSSPLKVMSLEIEDEYITVTAEAPEVDDRDPNDETY